MDNALAFTVDVDMYDGLDELLEDSDEDEVTTRASKQMEKETGRNNNDRKDKAIYGIIWYIIYAFLKSFNYVTADLTYAAYTESTPFPFSFMFMRSCFAVVLILAMTNKKAKKMLWDDIEKKDVGPLAFRCLQGTFTNIINYFITSVLPIAVVGVITGSVSPPLVMIFGVCVLKEKVKMNDVIFLTVVVILSVAIVFAASVGENDVPADEE